MLRNIQIKIILIFLIVGIIIIGAMGYINYTSLQSITTSQTENIEEYSLMIQKYQGQLKIITLITIFIFTLICVLVGVFVTKKIISPITRLINSAKKIASGEEVQTKELAEPIAQNEVDDLVNAFYVMTRELKENLSEVSRKKNQIETILLHMTDGIIAFNMEGRIELINPAATRLLRLLPEDENFEKIFQKLNVNINLEKIIYLENWTSSEERVTIGDNHMHMHFAPLKNEDDIPSGVIVVIQDITEHVKLSEMRKEFVADVSHELKTPIALIQGYSEGLLENVNNNEESRKFYAEVILDETNKMDKLVKQLLELMKLEYGKREFNDKQFNIVDLEKEVVRKSKVMLEEKKIEVIFNTLDEINIIADDFYIEQVISNYITNAIKHVKEVEGKKFIEIKNEVNIEKNTVRIGVFNSGDNIPEENLDRIWKRFYKIDESRNRQDGGTGIGLSLVKAIMENYKKEYGVINKENGVEFYFELELSV